MAITNEFSVISIFLSLVSILGSLFYLQLSNWHREILGLKQKVFYNTPTNSVEEKAAMAAARFEYFRLFNSTIVIVTITISLFLALVSTFALILLSSFLCTERVAVFVFVAFIAFLLTYTVLTLYFLISGYVMKSEIYKKNGAYFK